MVANAFLPTSLVIDTILKPLGLDRLPPLEAAITLDFDFCGRDCLVATKSASSSSIGHLVPRINLGARLETQRGLKSTLSDCEGYVSLLRHIRSSVAPVPSLVQITDVRTTPLQRNYVNKSLPATVGNKSVVLANVLDFLRGAIDVAYTVSCSPRILYSRERSLTLDRRSSQPAVILAHVVRSLATLELPDRLCSVIVSAESSIPVCGHRECLDSHKKSLLHFVLRSMVAHKTGQAPLDDKITFTLDSDALNLLNPTRLFMTMLPLVSPPVSVSVERENACADSAFLLQLATLVQSHGRTLVRRLPITFSTHMYRRSFLLNARPLAAMKAHKARKASTLPRMLKRKASTRLLSDLGTAGPRFATIRADATRRSTAFASLKSFACEEDEKLAAK